MDQEGGSGVALTCSLKVPEYVDVPVPKMPPEKTPLTANI